MDHRIEFDEKCKSCRGTGLYVGMAERDGAAVVCHTCGGSGCHHVTIQYDDFLGRVPRDDVKRVLEVNPGICVGSGNGCNLRDFGGMNYDDWWEGHEFPSGSEMRKYTCPAWWYQSADYHKKPSWDECIGVGTFSQCSMFSSKEKCWAKWDALFSG